jgi:hypothetical protein
MKYCWSPQNPKVGVLNKKKKKKKKKKNLKAPINAGTLTTSRSPVRN